MVAAHLSVVALNRAGGDSWRRGAPDQGRRSKFVQVTIPRGA